MSPDDVSALLRIKQIREQRGRARLEAARRVERDAAAQTVRLTAELSAFETAALASREAAYCQVEGAGQIGAGKLQAITADLAGLTAQASDIADRIDQAEAAELRVHAQTTEAEQQHRLAQRAAEAFDYLHLQLRAGDEARASAAEELEAEEPRSRLVLGER